MVGQLLLFSTLFILFFWSLLFGISHYITLKNRANNSAQHGRPRRHYQVNLRKACLRLVVLPAFLTILSLSGLAANFFDVYENNDPVPSPTPTESIPLPVDPDPVFPTTPPISNEEELSLSFRLSGVENSIMLTLDKELIGNASINVGQLAAASDRQLVAYIAQYCHPTSFFPFYPTLNAYFPTGEEIDYSFDSVSSLDECNAQLRGIGERLERYKNIGALEWMGETCHHLAIRSRDAMNFAKYHEMENQQNRSIWLYSEISFSALINEYIYNQPSGLALSDWYYRTAQVFDYLGGIADTEELELRMYFLSAVFLRCSYETLKEQGLQVYSNAYDYEIWNLYVEMLYRVAICVDSTETEGFYLEIQQVETTILEQALPDTVITHTTKILNSLALYQEWRAHHG